MTIASGIKEPANVEKPDSCESGFLLGGLHDALD